MSYTIHPKYFNKVIGSVGVLCLVVILWGTITYFNNQQDRFEKGLGDGYEISQNAFFRFDDNDSLSISQFEGSPVILDFWATWSRRSQQAHARLNDFQKKHPEYIIIAASVKDNIEYITEYIDQHDYDFIYTDGTHAYQDYMVPGVPTQLLFDREGKLQHVFVGFRNERQFEEVLLYGQ